MAGFTAVFVLLGVGATAIREAIGVTLQGEIAGFLMIVIGLAFMGLLPLPKRLLAPGLVTEAAERGSAVLLGAAFAACAAPCIGAPLAAILLLASDSDTVYRGAVLLAAYSLGLAAAFVLAGVFFAARDGPVPLAPRPLHAAQRGRRRASSSRSACCSSSGASGGCGWAMNRLLSPFGLGV